MTDGNLLTVAEAAERLFGKTIQRPTKERCILSTQEKFIT